MLEHHAEAATLRWKSRDIFAAEQHASAVRHFVSRDDPERRRFPRAGSAYEGEQLPGRHGERHVLHPRGRGEPPRHPLDGQLGGSGAHLRRERFLMFASQ
jgi:hypothetical protein